LQLLAELFNLISAFMGQEDFRALFSVLLIATHLSCSSSQLRAVVRNLISSSADHPQLRHVMLRDGMLQALSSNMDCKLCSLAFETILSNEVSMKFANRRHLEASDKTASGFYASRGQRVGYHDIMHSDHTLRLSKIAV
jgi:hypothetical protein